MDASGRGAVMCAIAGEQCVSFSRSGDCTRSRRLTVIFLATYSWNDIEASPVMSSDRVKILELLLEYAEDSLYAFNAPQSGFNGVTPLGMAAWLNSAIAVQLLLDNSSGVVDVDGMDSHGATPLMCESRKVSCHSFRSRTCAQTDAARDGNLEIVHLLVRNSNPLLR